MKVLRNLLQSDGGQTRELFMAGLHIISNSLKFVWLTLYKGKDYNHVNKDYSHVIKYKK